MDTPRKTDDPRAMLVERLSYLDALLSYIGEQWQAKAAIGQRYQPLAPLKGKWGVRPLLLWTVGITLALFTVATPIRYLAYNLVALVLSNDWAEAHRGLVTLLQIAIPIVMGIGLALLIVWARNKHILPRQTARIRKANQRRENHNAVVQTDEKPVDARLRRAGEDFAKHLGTQFYPQSYMYPEAVQYCVAMVRNHRADNVREALNLFETELHRRRVEDAQAAILAEQKQTQRQVAAGTVINAAMTGAAINTIRAEGKATRAASAANAARVTSQMRKPKTVYVKKNTSWW